MDQGGKKTKDGASYAESPATIDEGPSLRQRIGSSASGLLQSSFGMPSAGAVAQDLASLQPQGSKGTPNPGFGHFCEASSSSSSHSSQASGERSGPSSSLTVAPFRTEHNREGGGTDSAQDAFDEFLANSRNTDRDIGIKQDGPLVYQSEIVNLPRPGQGTSKSAFGQDCRPPRPFGASDSKASSSAESDRTTFHVLAGVNSMNRERTGLFQNVNEKEEDGAAVVTLLSDPTFSGDTDPADSWDHDSVEYGGGYEEKAKPYPQTQLPATQTDLKAVTSLLDLIPNFNPSREAQHPSIHGLDDQGIPSDGITLPNDGELQPWLDILGRYQDEVWGDMLPLVQEAREEIRNATTSKQGALEDRPAIRRLGMLLSHLKSPVKR